LTLSAQLRALDEVELFKDEFEPLLLSKLGPVSEMFSILAGSDTAASPNC
jgi:hypothetical protein